MTSALDWNRGWRDIFRAAPPGPHNFTSLAQLFIPMDLGLLDDLLASLDSHICEENDVTLPSLIQAALVEAPPVDLPPDASLTLLQDCFDCLWTERISAPPSVPVHAGADPILPSTSISKKPGESHLSRAVKNRIQNIGQSLQSSEEASCSETAAATEGKGGDDASLDNTSADDLDEDDHSIATSYFQSFLAEMKDLQKFSRQLQTKQDVLNYAGYLKNKYIVLGFDKLSIDCSTATKSRSIIESFIAKLRIRADGSTVMESINASVPWKCDVCTFENAPGDGKCQTCGRKRGTTPKKKAPRPVYFPLISSPARAKKSNKTPLDRQRDIFLKQKDDYEQDAREDIADEISQLLAMVRGANNET